MKRIKYSATGENITVNRQVVTDCHSYNFVNKGNTRAYLNRWKRLDPGATFAVAPSDPNCYSVQVYTVHFEDFPGATYDSTFPRENLVEFNKTMIDYCN